MNSTNELPCAQLRNAQPYTHLRYLWVCSVVEGTQETGLREKLSPACSVVGPLGHGDSFLERTMRRYKGRRPWNYLTLLLVLAVLALAVFPTVLGAKKEPDYYEVCTSVRREAVYLVRMYNKLPAVSSTIYHASIIPTAVVRKLVFSLRSPFRNALHVATVTTSPTIPAKAGLQVLPAESQVLPVKVPFRCCIFCSCALYL